jgi:hypothetical protein
MTVKSVVLYVDARSDRKGKREMLCAVIENDIWVGEWVELFLELNCNSR